VSAGNVFLYASQLCVPLPQCLYLPLSFSETWWNYCTSWWSLVSLKYSCCTTCNQQLVNSWPSLLVSISQLMLLTVVLLFLCPVCISMFPKCTHESFSQKLYEKFKNNKRFSKPKLSRTAFTIQHYAGEVSISWNTLLFASAFNWIYSFQFPEFFFLQVTYQSDHFLDKNRDYVVVEHEELLNASKCSFVSGLFPSVPEENTKSSKSSIANRFKVWFC
jgi:hypothetical protein